MIPTAGVWGAIGYRRRQWEAGLGEHTVCALCDPKSSWAALSKECSAWGHGVFSSLIIINETFGNAGIHIGVIQLEFCCCTVASTLELPAAFSCAALYWVCPVRGGGSPGAVGCSLCANITAKLLTRQCHPHGARSNHNVTPCHQLRIC